MPPAISYASSVVTSFHRSEPARTAVDRNFQPSEAGSVVWSALCEDSDAAVLVVAPNGIIQYSNAATGRLFGGRSHGDTTGRHLREIMDDRVAEERARLAAEVAASGKAMAIEGMINGRMVRSVMRPAPGRSGATFVLIVSRLAVLPEESTIAGRITVRRAEIDDLGRLTELTAREMEILKLVGAGLSTAEIAEKLGRSVKTIEWHRVSLGQKLGVTNRVELARIAISCGLVSAEAPPAAP